MTYPIDCILKSNSLLMVQGGGILTNDANCNQLQESLHKLEEWQHRWQIEFSPSNVKPYESQQNKIRQ